MEQIISVPVKDVRIINRIRQELGDISSLAENIKTNGLLSPILITHDRKLLAGERRLTACRELGWLEIPAIIKSVNDAEQELYIEIAENINRKSFTKEERVNCGLKIERIEKVKAEERQKARLIQFKQRNDTVTQNLGQRANDFTKHDSSSGGIVAKQLGISEEQYRREKFIVANKAILSDSEYAAWNTGEISTNLAYKTIKERQKTIADGGVLSAKDKRKNDEANPTENSAEKIPSDYSSIKEENGKLRAEIENLREQISSIKEQQEDPADYQREINDVKAALLTEQQNHQKTREQLERRSIEAESLRKTYQVSYENTAVSDEAFGFCEKCEKFKTEVLWPIDKGMSFSTLNKREIPGELFETTCREMIQNFEDLLKKYKTEYVGNEINGEYIEIS